MGDQERPLGDRCSRGRDGGAVMAVLFITFPRSYVFLDIFWKDSVLSTYAIYRGMAAYIEASQLTHGYISLYDMILPA